MAKRVFLIFFFSLILAKGYSQKLNLIGRFNLGIGTEYQNLDYNGASVPYSPGGGIGVEIGFQSALIKNLMIQSTLGYQLNLALQAESSNGASNKTSFSFNRKFVSLGLAKKFELSEGIIDGFLIGSGINYNFPGRLKRIENDDRLGESEYSANLGYYFELGLRLDISQSIFLDPAIRYRRLNFVANSFSEGTVTELPRDLIDLNANGIELGLTIVKKLRSNG